MPISYTSKTKTLGCFVYRWKANLSCPLSYLSPYVKVLYFPQRSAINKPGYILQVLMLSFLQAMSNGHFLSLLENIPCDE